MPETLSSAAVVEFAVSIVLTLRKNLAELSLVIAYPLSPS
jgi:hypothetical protein